MNLEELINLSLKVKGKKSGHEMYNIGAGVSCLLSVVKRPCTVIFIEIIQILTSVMHREVDL